MLFEKMLAKENVHPRKLAYILSTKTMISNKLDMTDHQASLFLSWASIMDSPNMFLKIIIMLFSINIGR